MADAMRLRVLKALTRQLEERVDMTGLVFRGKGSFGPASGGPDRMISIMEDPMNAQDYPEQTERGKTGVTDLGLFIMGYDVEDKENPDNPTDKPTNMMRDVKNAIKGIMRDGAATADTDRDLLGLGSPVAGIKLGQGHVWSAFSNEMTGVAFFELPLTISFLED